MEMAAGGQKAFPPGLLVRNTDSELFGMEAECHLPCLESYPVPSTTTINPIRFTMHATPTKQVRDQSTERTSDFDPMYYGQSCRPSALHTQRTSEIITLSLCYVP